MKLTIYYVRTEALGAFSCFEDVLFKDAFWWECGPERRYLRTSFEENVGLESRYLRTSFEENGRPRKKSIFLKLMKMRTHNVRTEVSRVYFVFWAHVGQDTAERECREERVRSVVCALQARFKRAGRSALSTSHAPLVVLARPRDNKHVFQFKEGGLQAPSKGESVIKRPKGKREWARGTETNH